MLVYRKKQNSEKPIPRERPAYYERRVRRWRNRVALVLLTIAVILWGQLLLRSEYFSVQGVHLSGFSSIDERSIRERIDRYLRGRIWFIFPRSNIMLLHTGDMQFFLERDVRISSARIRKEYRRRM